MIASTSTSTAAARTALSTVAAAANRITHEAVIDQHITPAAASARTAGVRWVMPVLDLTGLSVLVTKADKAALDLAAPQGRLARRAPAVDPQRVETIHAFYLWNLLARSLSPAAAHRWIEVRDARNVYFLALGRLTTAQFNAILDVELLAAAVVGRQPAEVVRMPAYVR